MEDCRSFKDVVCIAREIASNGLVLNRFMNEGESLTIDVMPGILHIVQNKVKKRFSDDHRIEVRDQIEGNFFLYGMAFDHPSQSRSVVNVGRFNGNRCWRRFVTTKELMHLYTGYFCDLGSGIENVLVTALESRNKVLISEDMELDPETFCLFLALEILLPYQYREKIYRFYAENGNDSLAVAYEAHVPSKLIEFFFNGYSKISDHVHASYTEPTASFTTG